MVHIYKPYIFVGAGLASLSTVVNLLERKHASITKNDILILEAGNYKGGRIKTSESENIEIGASWLHDSLDNQVLNYMLKHDLITFEKTKLEDVATSKKVVGCFDDNVKLLLYKGQSYTNDNRMRLEILLDEFEKYVENHFFQEENLDKDPSLKLLFMQYINDRKAFFKQNDLKQLELLSLLVRYVETWHGISWENLSAKYSFMHSLGQNIMCFGFNKFLNHISDGVSVRYGECVKSIFKKKHQYIINDKYVTDNCILGIPQSCFNDINFGENLINKELRDSYKKTHYGSLGKIIIEFENDFDFEHTRLYHMGCISENDSFLINQAMNTEVLDLFSAESSIQKAANDKKVTLDNIFDWPMLVVNHQSIISKPVLLVLTQEPVTSFIELKFSSSPNMIVPHLKPLLDNIGNFLYKNDYQDAIVKNVSISDWSQNNYQKGTYPACYPNDDPLDITVQTSIQNSSSKLKIIGEYTNLEGCGSLNGAWLSGVECAEKLLDQL